MAEPESFALDPNTPWGRSVTDAEFAEMVRTGRLQGELLARYWRMNEFQQPMPEYLDIMISKQDFERLIRESKKKRWKR